MAERVAGLVLAAGAGRRFGRPKALVEFEGEALVQRAGRALTEAGCEPVRVVVGAAAAEVRRLLAQPWEAVEAPRWQEGMGESLKAGLQHLIPRETRAAAVLVHLVDLPWIPPSALRRVLAEATETTVARAAYDGVPGHPVLFGRRWWPEVAAAATGDRGARDWLKARTDVRLVECGDLGNGHDVDRPADLERPVPPER
ncbi:nucleotidyltransferase family protein [Amycolatopsis jiangsuensis]|uniref:Nicotine blue oxidoreductase n=1 Tax=Amycolatopsis jiangsuensis TaxID=1181879 RepID=A0A840IVZ0_9PSEU|nr:nucleotidyltransferase family protein [Amycolatopsis jiangsuensis]MBB4685382.1 nicotine blue oxidoreductase [Amycolatopsis jiangsuensis]